MSFKSVVDEIRRLTLEEGLRDDEIAAIIGCCRATVNRERIRNGIPTANLQNRKDKICICHKCGGKVYIRRKERKVTICESCRVQMESRVRVKTGA